MSTVTTSLISLSALRALNGLIILGLSVCTAVCSAPQSARAERGPYLQPGGKKLPPFLASMEKHEVMIEVVSKRDLAATPQPVGAGVKVGLRVLAQGNKVSEYEEVTDAKGRAFFLGVPSNPKVQGMISYDAWVNYQGVRFPFNVKGVPSTEDKDALYDDFNPEVRLPENRITLAIYAARDETKVSPSAGLKAPPPPSLDQLRLKYDIIEVQVDEDALLVNQRMTLTNQGDRLIDLATLPEGGLKITTPDGAKAPGMHREREDIEVRGANLFYTGALLPKGKVEIHCYYTIPHRADRFEWRQTQVIPSEVELIVTPHFKRQHHQAAFNLELHPKQGKGRVALRNSSSGPLFQVVDQLPDLAAKQALEFEISEIPAPSRAGKNILLGSIGAMFIWVLWFGWRRQDGASTLSRTQLIIERDQLLKALERLERLLERKQISQPRYQREREAITARLVTIYRALERMEAPQGA